MIVDGLTSVVGDVTRWCLAVRTGCHDAIAMGRSRTAPMSTTRVARAAATRPWSPRGVPMPLKCRGGGRLQGEDGAQGRITGLDRHRGGGHPPTPATPPCIRVRTRRFERLR